MQRRRRYGKPIGGLRLAVVVRDAYDAITVQDLDTQRITKDGRIVEVWLTATAMVNEVGQMYAMAPTERTGESTSDRMMETQHDQQG